MGKIIFWEMGNGDQYSVAPRGTKNGPPASLILFALSRAFNGQGQASAINKRKPCVDSANIISQKWTSHLDLDFTLAYSISIFISINLLVHIIVAGAISCLLLWEST